MARLKFLFYFVVVSSIFYGVALSQTGSIYVTSDPPGAEIIYEGVPTGLYTPNLLDPLPLATNEITVSMPGYVPYPAQDVLWVMDGLTNKSHFDMFPFSIATSEYMSMGQVAFGTLDADTNYADFYHFTFPGGDLEIEIDASDFGSYMNVNSWQLYDDMGFNIYPQCSDGYSSSWSGHATCSLSAGNYGIGLEQLSNDFLTPNRWYYLYLNVAGTGSVNVTSKPYSGAQILVDGVQTGLVTPYVLTGMDVGTHEIRIDYPGSHSLPPFRDVDVSSFHQQDAEFYLMAGEATPEFDLGGCIGKNDLVWGRGDFRSGAPVPTTYCVDMSAGESLRIELYPYLSDIIDESITFDTPVDYATDEIEYPFVFTANFSSGGIYDFQVRSNGLWYFLKTELLADRRLFVDSDPEGAQIYVDSVDTGQTTPATISDISAGPHEVELNMSGYYSVPDVYRVEITRNGVVTADFKLFTAGAATGEIEVTSFPETSAEVWLDGADTGLVTPAVLADVSPTTHEVEIRKTGKYSYPAARTVRVISGQRAKAHFSLVGLGECAPNMSLTRLTEDAPVSETAIIPIVHSSVVTGPDRLTVLYVGCEDQCGTYLRSFDSTGTPLSPPLRPATSPWSIYKNCQSLLVNPAVSSELWTNCLAYSGINSIEEYTLQSIDVDGNVIIPPARIEESENGSLEISNNFPLGSSSSGIMTAFWLQDEPDGVTYTAYLRKYSAAGDPLGPPERIVPFFPIEYYALIRYSTSQGNTNIFLTWSNLTPTVNYIEPKGRAWGMILDETATPVAGPFQIDQEAQSVGFPKVISLSDNTFMLAWDRHALTKRYVMAQHFDGNGNGLGEVFEVAGFQNSLRNSTLDAIAEDINGNIWFFGRYPGNNYGQYIGYWVRRFTVDGKPLGPVEFLFTKDIENNYGWTWPHFFPNGKLMAPFYYKDSSPPPWTSEFAMWDVCPVDWDGDGLNDYDETETIGTDPALLDSDGDTFDDGIEVLLGTDPLNPNSHPISQDFDIIMTNEGGGEGGGCSSCSIAGNSGPDPMMPVLLLLLLAARIFRFRRKSAGGL